MTTARDREPLEILAEEYLERQRTGEAVSIEEYARLHPELAAEIRDLFPTLDAMELVSDPPPQTIGDYEIVRELGRGGQGTVFLAHDRKLSREVALKVLAPSHGGAAPDRIARFRREAEAAARVDHPGVCAVYEAGDADGTHFIAMRYVEGQPLSDILHEARAHPGRGAGTVPLPEGVAGTLSGETSVTRSTSGSTRRDVMRVVALFERAARALHAVHEHGLVHRDVKPGNIMLTAAGEPVLLDLGLARTEDSGTLTLSGDMLGTPAYMSPEQIRGSASVDHRTDVYSLAVALYECLTLERPFDAPTREGTYRRILEQRPTRTSRLNRRVPRDLDVVLETALEKDRERRYASALELAEDLHRLRTFQPIRARRASWPVSVLRWSQRNRLAAVFILLLVSGLAVTGDLLRRIQGQARTNQALLAARAARDMIEVNPLVALELARSAVELERSPESLSAVQEALAEAYEIALFRHDAIVTCAVPSSDGGRVLTASADGTARLWDVESGAERVRFEGHGTQIDTACFSPDERYVLTGGRDGTARLWSVTDGTRAVLVLRHGSIVHSVSFAVLGAGDLAILTGGSDGTARLWSLDGTEQQRFEVTPEASPVIAEYSPLSGWIVTAAVRRGWHRSAGGKVVKVWEADGTPVGTTELPDDVWTAGFSPDGRTVGIAGLDEAYLWDVATDERKTLPGHGNFVRTARFSPSGDVVVTASHDKVVRMWTADGALLHEMHGHERPATEVAFSADGTLIATIGDDQTVRVWNTLGQQLATMRGHYGTEVMSTVAFVPGADPPRIVSASQDGTARVWQLWDEDLVTLYGHVDTISWAVFDPRKDWRWVATIGWDGELRLWDRAGHATLLEDEDREGRWVHVSPDGKKVVFCHGVDGIEVWDVASRTKEKFFWLDGRNAYTAEFSPSGGQLLVASGSSVFELAYPDLDIVHEHRFPNNVLGAFWTQDGGFLATDTDGWVTRVEGNGSQMPWRAHGGGYLWTAYASPDSSRVVTAGHEGTVKLWTVEGELLQVLRGPPHPVSSAVFAPNGELILSAHQDGARLWTLDGELVVVLRGHRGPIVGAVFTPDGSNVVTLSHDGTARFWPADPDRLLALADERLYRELDAGELASLLGAAVEEEPAPTVEDFTRPAAAHASSGRLFEAVESYRAAVAAFPDSARAHNLYAWFIVTHPGAEVPPAQIAAVAERLVELTSGASYALGTAGGALYRAGDYRAAIDMLERYRAATGVAGPDCLFFLAMAHYRRGEEEQARSTYQLAVESMSLKVPGLTKTEAVAFYEEATALIER